MTEHVPDTDLLAPPLGELELGSARGGRKLSAPLAVEVVRVLCSDDLDLLASPPAQGQLPARLLTIRHSHHQLARLLALGTDQTEISLITGYSPSYISNIKHDPQFTDLISTYAAEREQVYIDVIARMRVLGLNTLEELTARLESEGDKWSRRELMELAELMLLKPMTASATSRQAANSTTAGTGGGVTVNVKFVSATPAESGGGDGPVINITPGRAV